MSDQALTMDYVAGESTTNASMTTFVNKMYIAREQKPGNFKFKNT